MIVVIATPYYIVFGNSLQFHEVFLSGHFPVFRDRILSSFYLRIRDPAPIIPSSFRSAVVWRVDDCQVKRLCRQSPKNLHAIPINQSYITILLHHLPFFSFFRSFNLSTREKLIPAFAALRDAKIANRQVHASMHISTPATTIINALTIKICFFILLF